MVNFLKIFEKFFCTDCVGHSNCVSGFALTGRLLFCTDPAGCSNRVSVFALTGRLLSLHRLSGALELPQAGSPFPGGEFSAEPQRGIRRLRTAGTCRAPRRGQKGRDTCGFPSSLNSYLSLVGIAWVQTVDCVSRKRTRQSGYSCVSFSAFSQFTDSVLLHRRFTLRRARHDSAAQTFGTL